MKEGRSARVTRLSRHRSDRIAVSSLKGDELWGGCPKKSWSEWGNVLKTVWEDIDAVDRLCQRFGVNAVLEAKAKIEEHSVKMV